MPLNLSGDLIFIFFYFFLFFEKNNNFVQNMNVTAKFFTNIVIVNHECVSYSDQVHALSLTQLIIQKIHSFLD